MDRLTESVKKSLATKRSKFSLTRGQYVTLQNEVVNLELGLGSYSRLQKIARAHGIEITQNRTRTLLKDIIAGLSYDSWSQGKSVPKPDGVAITGDNWELARALSEKAGDPELFDAIIRAAKTIRNVA